MASLTKLRRRALRWRRYADRTGGRLGERTVSGQGGGLWRAVDAVNDRLARRRSFTVYWPIRRPRPPVVTVADISTWRQP